jgi:hypothetical protein
MAGHYRRRRSAAAYWCERIALLCLPYFALAIVLHRTENISSPQVIWLIAVGLLLLFTSLALGIRALTNLWRSGARGGKAATRGIVLSLILLSPFAWFGYLVIEHPSLNDVTTSPYTPPRFIAAQEFRERHRQSGINAFTTYDEEYANIIAAAYPRLGSRRYNAGAERIYEAVRSLIMDRGWDITAVYDTTPDQPVSSLPVPEARPMPGEEDTSPQTLEPDIRPIGVKRIEAVAASLIFGFKSDIVVAIIPEAETTLVDMRSASRWGKHDFGKNAELIRKFLEDLDSALLGIGGEG